MLCCDGLLNSPQGLGAQGAADAALLTHFRNVGPELVEALEESLALNINWSSDAEPDILSYYSEYRRVIEMAKKALSRAKEVEVP